MQLDQEPRGVIGVDRRLERQIQVRESGGVLQQVDLHASDIDRVDTASLQGLNRFDRVRFAIEV
jgi:hypothetical protein